MSGRLNLGLNIKLIDGFTRPMRAVRESVGGLTRATRAANLAFGGLVRSMRTVASVGAIGIGAVSVGIISATRRFADAGDAALETSQKVGVSVPAFMRWTHAAKQSGVEAASLEDALKFLNLSSSAAADGAKQDSQAFQRLGVAYKDAHGKLIPMERLLPEIADAFSKLEDGPRKAAIAQALFGRAGTDMIPMLNEGAAGLKKWGDEAQRLGLVMSQQAAENADEFNDSVNTLHQSIFGLSNGIVAGLLPNLTILTKQMTAMIAANKPQIIERVKTIFGQLSAQLPGIISNLGKFATFLGGIAAAVTPLISLIGGFSGVLDVLGVVMMTRLTIGIWSAVAAVWGLNGAMLANPIGIVIASIGALILVGGLLVKNWGAFSGFFGRMWGRIKTAVSGAIGVMTALFMNFHPFGLIIRHWSTITAFFSDLWEDIKGAFKTGVEAVWSILPGWFRQVLRGGTFIIRALSAVGAGPRAAAAASAPPPVRAPRPAIGAAADGRRGVLDVNVNVDQNGRVRGVEARSRSPDFAVANIGAIGVR